MGKTNRRILPPLLAVLIGASAAAGVEAESGPDQRFLKRLVDELIHRRVLPEWPDDRVGRAVAAGQRALTAPELASAPELEEVYRLLGEYPPGRAGAEPRLAAQPGAPRLSLELVITTPLGGLARISDLAVDPESGHFWIADGARALELADGALCSTVQPFREPLPGAGPETAPDPLPVDRLLLHGEQLLIGNRKFDRYTGRLLPLKSGYEFFPGRPVQPLAVDGEELFYFADRDGIYRCHADGSPGPEGERPFFSQPATALAVLPGELVAVGTPDRGIYLLERSGKLLQQVFPKVGIRALHFSRDLGLLAAATSSGNKIHLIRLGSEGRLQPGSTNLLGDPTLALAFLGGRLVAASEGAVQDFAIVDLKLSDPRVLLRCETPVLSDPTPLVLRHDQVYYLSNRALMTLTGDRPERGIGLPQQYRSLALDASGNLWTAGSQLDRFDRGSQRRTVLEFPETPGYAPTALALDPAGNVLLRLPESGPDLTLSRVTPAGEATRVAVVDGPLDGAGWYALAPHPAGGWVVTTGSGGRVVQLAADGREQWRSERSGERAVPWRRPVAAAVDRKGRIWVLDAAASRLVVLSPEGRPLGSYGRFGSAQNQLEWNQPSGLAAVGEYLYLADAGNRRLLKLKVAD